MIKLKQENKNFLGEVAPFTTCAARYGVVVDVHKTHKVGMWWSQGTCIKASNSILMVSKFRTKVRVLLDLSSGSSMIEDQTSP